MFLPCVHMTMKLLGHRLLKMSSRVEFLKTCVWSLKCSFTFLKTMMTRWGTKLLSAGSPFSSLFFIFIFEQKRFSSAYCLRLPTTPLHSLLCFAWTRIILKTLLCGCKTILKMYWKKLNM